MKINPKEWIMIEVTDEADRESLKNKLSLFLQELDNGDYKGRVIK